MSGLNAEARRLLRELRLSEYRLTPAQAEALLYLGGLRESGARARPASWEKFERLALVAPLAVHPYRKLTPLAAVLLYRLRDESLSRRYDRVTAAWVNAICDGSGDAANQA